jgi:hypothetical protein
MIPVKFKQANVNLGESQEEYQNLPAFFGQVGPTEKHTGYVYCHELSSDDLNVINATKQIWSSQMTFGHPLNPVNIMVHDPFENSKDYQKSIFSTSDIVSFGNYVLSHRNKDNDPNYTDLNGVSDADLANWSGSDYKETHFLTAREAKMLELLEYAKNNILESDLSTKFKIEFKQLLKEVKP